MNLRIHPLAIAEIDHEVDYYESKQTVSARSSKTNWTPRSSCSFDFRKQARRGGDVLIDGCS
jgi:hypothetical protein